MLVDGTKSLWGMLAALVSWCSLQPVLLAGELLVETPNFTVAAESTSLAGEVGMLAEDFRREIAREWLSRVLPAAPQRVAIRLSIVAGPSQATTLVDPHGTNHHIAISAAEMAQAESLLRHEIAHTVLLTALGEAIPDWANEGIASRYDNAQRHAIRERKLREFVALESWPPLETLLTSPIKAQWSYAASVSLTDFLVAQRGKQEFIAFLTTAHARGYDTALTSHYGIESVGQLEAAWRNHVRGHVRNHVAQKHQDESREEPALVR